MGRLAQLEESLQKPRDRKFVRNLEIRNNKVKVVTYVKMPKCMKCWACSMELNKGKKMVEMYICSPLWFARDYDTIIWKCPACKKTKVEKVDRGDGHRFYREAQRAGIVLVGS